MRDEDIKAVAVTALSIIIVLSIWLWWGSLYTSLSDRGYSGLKNAELGPWGDSFGALTSLFTALGFLAVVGGFRLQRKQVRDGQDEQHRQRFDDWYFELLRLLREARDAVTFRHSPDYHRLMNMTKLEVVPVQAGAMRRKSPRLRGSNFGNLGQPVSRPRETFKGERAFQEAWLEIKYFTKIEETTPDRQCVIDIYEERIHLRNESVFGPYFRILYTILERVDSDKILTSEEKYRYGRLLRSQLTSFETALVGINGLPEFSKDFDRLVIEFRLLKYLPGGNRRKLLEAIYPSEAFMPRD